MYEQALPIRNNNVRLWVIHLKVIKKLNNNVIIAFKDGNQVVAFGKGIGFNIKGGDIVSDDKVNQIFWNKQGNHSEEFDTLLKNTRAEYFEICNEIIKVAQSELKQDFNENFYFALLDHIQLAVNRFLRGIELSNLMLGDIRRLYPNEYEVGLRALQIIKAYLKVVLPDDEAGFIAFHIVNYEDGSQQVGAQKAMNLIREVSNVVKYELLLDIDEQSFQYQRFLTHLKFFSQRLLSPDPIQVESVDKNILNYVKTSYQDSFKCAEKISVFIQNKYHKSVPDTEIVYLTIHIHKIYSSSKNKTGL